MAKKEATKTEEVKVVEVEKKAEKKVETVKCVSPFYDTKGACYRKEGDEWKTDTARIKAIQAVEKDNGLKLIEVL